MALLPSHVLSTWFSIASDPLRHALSRPRLVEDAALEDADTLAALHDAAFPIGWSGSDLAALIANPAVETRVLRPLSAFGRGPIEGFIMVRQAADEGEILTFAVTPRCRGRGYGARLLDDGLMRLRHKGVSAVFLEVAEDNEAALTLYRRRGFTQVGERPAYAMRADGRKARALVMRREYR